MEPRKNTISECPHNLNIYDILDHMKVCSLCEHFVSEEGLYYCDLTKKGDKTL